MSWLLVVLAGHLANALAFVVDKILLVGKMKYPSVYVFYIGTLGLASFVLFPFGGMHLLSAPVMGKAFVSGASFVVALLAFFTALKKGETTRVAPFVGAFVSLWTILLAGFILGERLTGAEWVGIALLIFGSIIISYERVASATSITWSEAFYIVVAGGFFALSYTLAKAVFNSAEFIPAFLWMRLFAFVSVVPLLLLPTTRRQIFAGDGTRPPLLFYIGQSCGAIGFVLLSWGVERAPSVSIVNALQGVQYAFLFIFVVVLTRFAPRMIQEKLNRQIVLQKIIALIVLGIGLALVA
ncbi:MAG: EamA family transporter [Patescibacteria group bacterium]|jgi:drug/metabolite transporter (DMT)-like permease